MLRIDRQDEVTNLTLTRPEVRNAFNDELIAALDEAFASLDPETRVVTLRGEGKVFCAGGDLEWMRKAAGYTEEQNAADALKLANLFARIQSCRALTICVVQGAAFGGGLGLVAACDVAIAVQGTKFCFSEVRLGLIPATISSVVIPKIGPGHARALFATAEVFLADRAERMGLVHQVTATEEDALAAADKMELLALENGPQAVAEAKRLVLDYPLSLEETARRLARARAGEEGREGVNAFLEKRVASYNLGGKS